MGGVLLHVGGQPMGGKAKFRRAPYFRTKKLGILGRTQNIDAAPWADPAWTLVSHTSARPLCQREPDWYFDMHVPACFRTEEKVWNRAYHTWLKALQTPIFMQEEWPEIPMAVKYPIDRILQEYRAYFTNHAAYMVALAMTEGVTTIGLFGCQYGADSEYSTQRGSLEYWLGRYEQWGGTVVLPMKHNSLLAWPSKLYGYESHDLTTGKLIDEYRQKSTVALKAGAGSTHKAIALKLIETEADRAARPLAAPPKGESIALDRAALLPMVG